MSEPSGSGDECDPFLGKCRERLPLGADWRFRDHPHGERWELRLRAVSGGCDHQRRRKVVKKILCESRGSMRRPFACLGPGCWPRAGLERGCNPNRGSTTLDGVARPCGSPHTVSAGECPPLPRTRSTRAGRAARCRAQTRSLPSDLGQFGRFDCERFIARSTSLASARDYMASRRCAARSRDSAPSIRRSRLRICGSPGTPWFQAPLSLPNRFKRSSDSSHNASRPRSTST